MLHTKNMAESVSIQFQELSGLLGNSESIGVCHSSIPLPTTICSVPVIYSGNKDDLSISIVIRGRPWLAVLAT